MDIVERINNFFANSDCHWPLLVDCKKEILKLRAKKETRTPRNKINSAQIKCPSCGTEGTWCKKCHLKYDRGEWMPLGTYTG